MFITKEEKNAIKKLLALQKHGVAPGDKCPRCGQSSMTKDNFRTAEGIYVCSNCGMEIELSRITGTEDNILSWDCWKESAEAEYTMEYLTTKFAPGDRVADSYSDQHGLVVETLPSGLYSVLFDGETRADWVKGKELVFELIPEESAMLGYLKKIQERFPIGTLVAVFKIMEPGATLPDDVAIGEVTQVGDLGQLQIAVRSGAGAAEKGGAPITIFPDRDWFIPIELVEKERKDSPSIEYEIELD